jgi:ketosteroid isomerase-like protein
MRHAVALAIVLGIAGCPRPKPAETTPAASATPKEVVAAAKGVIEQWRQAYEVKSFDALAKLYVHDLDLVVVQDGLPLMGWSTVEPVLRERLTKAKEIHVRLKGVTVASLGPTGAAALATMTREISDGVTTVTENGALTLVLRRGGDGWQIVQEHYSFKRPS